MDAAAKALFDENAALKAELAVARAKASEDMALIAAQKLQIAKLQRQIHGQKSERSARLLDQLSLGLEELEASATEDELAAERAVAKTTTVAGFTRKRPERTTFPEHLPRERVVIDAPKICACCGGSRLRKLGEDYDPSDKVSAMKRIQEGMHAGEVVTGLLYVDPTPSDLHANLNTVDVPLNTLNAPELCPGTSALDKINASLR